MARISTVILDTNILQYGVNEALSEEIANLFPKLQKLGLGLVISGFTTFEVYRGLNKKKIPITRQLVDAITPLDVDVFTFKIAAVLYSCYQKHEATKGKNKYDDDGDVVIAANAIRYNAALLTANGNDYPRPFFMEINRFPIKRADNGAQVIIHLLKPDIQVFNETMHEHLM